jgi:Abnormal spindle-like microcephaly-assoc'd, ASPM-SPD-2-Hydin
MRQGFAYGGRRAAGLIAVVSLLAFPAVAQAGTLSASPPSSSFNNQPWFFGSQFNNFQVTNSGTDTTLGPATITGPDADRFALGGDGCNGLTLSDTNFCFVGAVFNPPNGPGTFSAQLEIPSDGSPDPLVIPLAAQSLAGPHFDATPNRLDFGPTIPGETQSRQVTVTNTGDFPGAIQQAFIVGPSEFELDEDRCSQQPLNPGQSCELTVLFAPSTARFYNGSLLAIAGSPTQAVLPLDLSGEGRFASGPAPETELVQSPPKKTRNKTASFRFTSPTAGVSFECKLDGEPFTPCTSPATYRVRRGKHSLQVRAVDADGVVDGSPAEGSWKVKKKKRK